MPTGGVLEEALEALFRAPERLLPGMLRRQVAHHRAGAQLLGRLADDGLGDEGLDDAAVGRLQRDLAAVGRRVGERHMGRQAGRRGVGQEVVQAQALEADLLVGGAEPVGQRLVDQLELAVAVDRVEADRRVLQEVGQARLLVVHDVLHLTLGGDVLQRPQHVAASILEGIGGELQPAHAAVLGHHRGLVGGAGTALGGIGQRRNLGTGGARVAQARDRRQRRVVAVGQHPAEARVGVDGAAGGVDDAARERDRVAHVARQVGAGVASGGAAERHHDRAQAQRGHRDQRPEHHDHDDRRRPQQRQRRQRDHRDEGRAGHQDLQQRLTPGRATCRFGRKQGLGGLDRRRRRRRPQFRQRARIDAHACLSEFRVARILP